MNGRIALLLSAVACAVPAVAQGPGPIGNEFAVNTYTTGPQAVPEIVGDSRGNFVIVWNSPSQDGDRGGLFGRRFDRRGRPRGPEFQVNVTTAGNQLQQCVAGDAAGNFMVVWRDSPGNGQQQLMRRRFDAGGVPGPELALTAPAFGQPQPALAMHPDGNALAVWAVQDVLRGRRFGPSGEPLGSELTIVPGDGPNRPDVAAAPDGGYLVVWDGRVGLEHDILGQRLNADGSLAGPRFLVNTYTTGTQELPRVAFDPSGSYMVVWNQGPFPMTDVRGRRFDPSGTPLGPDSLVHEPSAAYECCARLAADRDGHFTVMWTGPPVTFDVYARRFHPSGAPMGAQFVVPWNSAYFQSADGILAAPGGHAVATYGTDVADGDSGGVLGRFLGTMPMQLAVDTAPLQSNGNRVLEPGETVALEPSWANQERVDASLTGALSAFGGPGPSSYTIQDGAAAYGLLGPVQTASCTQAADCYVVTVSAPPVRPLTHWDATVRERVTGLGDQTWSLHVGGSFTDVPGTSAFYRFVETLLHHGVAGGCAADQYCPAAGTTREQLAVFVLAAKEGARYRPPDCTTPLFGDVPASSPFCRFIEELARRGVVSGCGGGNYCPAAFVTREEMAVFALRTLDPTLDPPACATPMFGDVPASSPFCRWIEELARRGVVTGCGGGNYCPGYAVPREQMAVFVSATFGLALYGP